MVKFTPESGFVGDASFSYTAESFTGNISLPATVNLTVEELRVNRAVLRPKFMKWRVQGTSSDVSANSITVRLGTGELSAILTGAKEVPPVTTSAGGMATVIINDALTEIGFSLAVQDILNMAAAHIHVGARGVNGPVIFNLSLMDFASPLTGTLTAADLQVQAAQGVNTFADAVNVILSGNAYVNVHTTLNPGGEIRGQLGPIRMIGTAQVGVDGTWSLDGKMPLGPDESGTVSIESSNGIRLQNLPVSVR